MTCRRACGSGTCRRIPAKGRISYRSGLVAVPDDADAFVIFRAKNLLNPDIGTGERFDLCHDSIQRGRNRFGPLQLFQPVIVSKSERSHPPLALKLSELEGLERKASDPGNKLLFDLQRNKVGGIAQPVRQRIGGFKKRKLVGHACRSLESGTKPKICRVVGRLFETSVVCNRWPSSDCRARFRTLTPDLDQADGAGSAALASIRRCCLSSDQKSEGIFACSEFQSSSICRALRAPTTKATATSAADEN
jgi:hypothetical protein